MCGNLKFAKGFRVAATCQRGRNIPGFSKGLEEDLLITDRATGVSYLKRKIARLILLWSHEEEQANAAFLIPKENRSAEIMTKLHFLPQFALSEAEIIIDSRAQGCQIEFIFSTMVAYQALFYSFPVKVQSSLVHEWTGQKPTADTV